MNKNKKKYFKKSYAKSKLSVEYPSHLNDFLIKSQPGFIKAVEVK